MRAFYLRNGWPIDCEYVGPDRRIRLPYKVPREPFRQATKQERRQMAREGKRGRRGSRRLWTPGAKRFYVPPPMPPYAIPVPIEHQWEHRIRGHAGQEFALYLPAGVDITEAHSLAVAEALGASPDYGALRAAGFGASEAREILLGAPGPCLRAEEVLREANDPDDEPALRVVLRKLEMLYGRRLVG